MRDAAGALRHDGALGQPARSRQHCREKTCVSCMHARFWHFPVPHFIQHDSTGPEWRVPNASRPQRQQQAARSASSGTSSSRERMEKMNSSCRAAMRLPTPRATTTQLKSKKRRRRSACGWVRMQWKRPGSRRRPGRRPAATANACLLAVSALHPHPLCSQGILGPSQSDRGGGAGARV